MFSILFQSHDSYIHFIKEKTEAECRHKSSSKHQITHLHRSLEHCFVCEFAFSSAVPFSAFEFNSQNVSFETACNFFYSDVVITFEKNSNYLRGPPVFNI
ncbi:MAG: hypothetical protein EBR38_06525 [Flavobacteriaceae bacterium]|nr:hypothetical protein [Flavobacteriaceae bacterium]